MLLNRETFDQAASIGEYIRRARQERELASVARSSQAASAHLARAGHYELLVQLTQDPGNTSVSFADDEVSNCVMSSRKFFPFYQARSTLSGVGTR